jgi:hypothetical protein
MKKVLLSLAAVAALCSPALSADLKMVTKAPPPPPPSPWDWAFGAATMSDYNFRGISQSNKGPSVTAYSETRYSPNANWQFYAGTQYWAVTLPTNPTAEVDLYGGVRPTIGPLALDFGFIYYWYPSERQHLGFPTPVLGAAEPQYFNGNVTLKDTDFWEVYGKGVWTVNDTLSLGFNEYYSPSWLHTGAYGNYFSGTAKVNLPNFKAPIFGDLGWFVSGEVGYYWLGTPSAVAGVFPTNSPKFPSYLTWNAGLAFTWKVATLDLRYYDTNLGKSKCNILTSDPSAYPGGTVSTLNGSGLQSNWCGAAFVAALKFDLTLANLK